MADGRALASYGFLLTPPPEATGVSTCSCVEIQLGSNRTILTEKNLAPRGTARQLIALAAIAAAQRVG
jgi:hypothetical protein